MSSAMVTFVSALRWPPNRSAFAVARAPRLDDILGELATIQMRLDVRYKFVLHRIVTKLRRSPHGTLQHVIGEAVVAHVRQQGVVLKQSAHGKLENFWVTVHEERLQNMRSELVPREVNRRIWQMVRYFLLDAHHIRWEIALQDPLHGVVSVRVSRQILELAEDVIGHHALLLLGENVIDPSEGDASVLVDDQSWSKLNYSTS